MSRTPARPGIEHALASNAVRMLVIARRILRDDDAAQDAVQDACVSALRAAPAFEGRAQATTWLHRIVVNAALARLRRRRRRPEEPLDELDVPLPAADPSLEEQLDRQRERALVRHTVDALSDTHRTVLTLRDLEQHDVAETALRLGVSDAAVRVRLHRARGALRQRLAAAARAAVARTAVPPAAPATRMLPSMTGAA